MTTDAPAIFHRPTLGRHLGPKTIWPSQIGPFS